MKTLRWLLPALCLALLLGWLGACSDDDNPTTPAGDQTAPVVVAVYPEDSDVNVDVDDSLYVFFSEGMDPASADGAVTLSNGLVTGSTWNTNRWLAVGHSDFDEGTQVTVTVGTELTDDAGNPLAAPRDFSFWTTSSDLLLVGTTPAQDDTGVQLNAGITLQFSDYVNVSEILDNVIITDTMVIKSNKAEYGFTVDYNNNNVYVLTLDGPMPASTTMYIWVPMSIQASNGKTPTQSYLIDFTTGTTTDTTPPTIVATDPANGTTNMSPDKGFVSLTFSEPVNTDSFEPSTMNLGFMMLVEGFSGEADPQWSAGNTVITIPLPSDLAAGTPYSITFVEFSDVNGNVQTTPYTYDIKVAGAADYVPVEDGKRYYDDIEWEEGDIGNPSPTNDGYYEDWVMIATQTDGSFREVEYFNPEFMVSTGAWDAFRKTSSALQWLGWEDPDEMIRKSNDFDTPLTILPLPISAGTWTATTTVDVEGEGTFTGTIEGRVLPQQDYVIAESRGQVFIKDAWIVIRELTAESGGELAISETDTVVYAPTLGAVRTSSYNIEYMENMWWKSVTWRWPWVEYMGGTKSFGFED